MAAEEGILLTPQELAEITNGRWIPAPPTKPILGVQSTAPEPGGMYVLWTKEQWRTAGNTPPETLQRIKDVGSTAVMSISKQQIEELGLPGLLVENTYNALEKIAVETRKRYKGKTILVTGTEGKTGFKLLLHHVLKNQCNSCASINSHNLTNAVWCCMASVTASTDVNTVEISVAQPRVGLRRGNYLQPDICVFTNIGPHHIETHGGLDEMIQNKASAMTGLQPDGICIVNANSPLYDRFREEIYKIRYVPFLRNGNGPFTDAHTVDAKFTDDKWHMTLDIRGHIVNCVSSLVGEHVPNTICGILLAVDYLGYDIEKAAADIESFTPFESMGHLEEMVIAGKRCLLYDQSFRGSTSGFISALKDVQTFNVKGKKIGVLGAMLGLGKLSDQLHLSLVESIKAAGFSMIFTFADPIKVIRPELEKIPGLILQPHMSDWKELKTQIESVIEEDDLLFVKGHHRVYLKHLTHAFREEQVHA